MKIRFEIKDLCDVAMDRVHKLIPSTRLRNLKALAIYSGYDKDEFQCIEVEVVAVKKKGEKP